MLLLLLLLAGGAARAVPAQETEGHGEPVEVEEAVPLSSAGIQGLYLLGKVWGFLKYHHPKVTEGCFDWDAELLERLGLAATAGDDVRPQLAAWIGELNDRACGRQRSDDVQARPDIGWLADHELLGLELGSELRSLETRAASTRPQFYVTLTPGNGLPQFPNERDYAELPGIDWRYRLLALVRLWNIVEYWYPHRALMGDRWDELLKEYLPRFYAAGDAARYGLALKALLAELQDGQARPSAFDDGMPPGGRAKPPFGLRLVEGRPFVGPPLALVPGAAIEYAPGECVEYGDLVIEVDGSPAAALMAEWAPYYAAANDAVRSQLLAWNLLRGDADIVTVSVDRAGTQRQQQCLRMPVDRIDARSGRSHDRPGVTLQLLSEDVAYLKVSTIDRSRIANYVTAAAPARGLVIDLRGPAAEGIADELGRHLVDVDTPYAQFTAADLAQPGTFRWTVPVAVKPRLPAYDGRVVILVDETTHGPAERAAMAFRGVPDALVVGTATAGAPGPSMDIPLPGGTTAAVSGVGVYYPDKTPVQRTGIVPDVAVAPTIAGLRAGRDEVMEVAIREIVGGTLDDEQIADMARAGAQD